MQNTDVILSAYILFWLAVLGAVMGSAMGCLADRYIRGESWLSGRSRCDSCGHLLKAGDMIPVVSYLAHRGRCPYCKEKIPASCLLAELFSMILFPVLGARIGISPELVMWLILGCMLTVVSLIDWSVQLIPDRFLLIAVIDRLIFFFLLREPWKDTIQQMALGSLGVTVPLFLLVLVMEKVLGKEAMGGGDLKLLFVMGLYYSWMEMLLLLILSCFTALIYAWSKRKKGLEILPFGPFLVAGWFLVMAFGKEIIAWYAQFFI